MENTKVLKLTTILLFLCFLAIFSLIIFYSSEFLATTYYDLKIPISTFQDYFMSFAYFIVICLLCFSYLYYKKHFKMIYIYSFFWKMFIIFLLFPVYEFYYRDNLDAFLFYHDATWNLQLDFLLGDATNNIISFFSFIHTFLGKSYRLVTVVLGTITWFVSIYFAENVLVDVEDSTAKKMVLLFMFFEPMFILWTSHYGKDPVVYTFSILTSVLLYRFYITDNYKYLFFSYLSLLPFLFFRFWYLLIYGAVISILWVLKTRGWTRFFILFTGGSIVIIVAIFVLRRFGVYNLDSLLQSISFLSQAWASGGSAQTVEINTWRDFFIFYPYMWFTALFRPLIFDAINIFALYVGLLDTILFVYALVNIYNFKYVAGEKRILFSLSLLVIIIWGALYGIVSYQNLGTAVRYRSPIWPWMLVFYFFPLTKNKKEKRNNSV